ncbi:MAG: hypothetical protein KGI41_03240 [Patescibacteria group bacterium]|nr:hypothetical protein [Patescibacteria group bacterium]
MAKRYRNYRRADSDGDIVIWLAFTVPLVGQNILWGNAKGALVWKRFFSDSFSNLVTYLLIAFVATLFF